MLFVNLIRKSSWVFYVSLLALSIFVALLGYHLLRDTGGNYVLPFDESYLQLSTAKTLAFRHVWGIGRYDFTSATPSLLYPVVLALAFWVFGSSIWMVPVVNMIIGTIFLWKVERWLAKKGYTVQFRLCILAAVIFLPSLPVMILYGMESPLLLLTAFLFLARLSDEWGAAAFSRQTLIYGALMMAARYDGVLLLGGICLLLLWQRRWLVAFELALWSLLPVLIFGILSMFKGSHFLPNVFMERSVKAFLSYDWLVGCGVAVGIPLLWNYLARPAGKRVRLAALVAGVILVPVLLTRDVYAFKGLQRNSREVYEVQNPVARFAYRYYSRYGILSDDIGQISFRTEGRYWDLTGLGNPGLLNRGRRGDSHIAIISDQYRRPLPASWIRTARWVRNGEEGVNTKTYTFYARDTSYARWLNLYLEDFTPFLPVNFDVEYFYSVSGEKGNP